MSTTTKKWMTELTRDFGVAASAMPKSRDSVIAMTSPSLNWALGNGGFVEGKAIIFYGPESSGKSLLAQLTMIEIQKKHPEGICIWFDAEYSFNREWFEKLGGDLDRLIVRQSNDPLKIFDYIWGDMAKLIQDGCPIKAIGIDSFRSILYPKDIKVESTKQTQGGSGAPYLTSALKRILPVIRDNGITVTGVQQVYEEMDEYKKMRNPYVVPDGRALKHFADYMIQVDKLETKDGVIEEGKSIIGGNSGIQIGHKVRCKVKKNRTSAPYRVAQFTLEYAKGVTRQGDEVFDLAKSLGIIYHPINPATGKENVQMWKFDDLDPVRGEDNMRAVVAASVDLQARIAKACDSADSGAIKAMNDAIGDVEIDDIE